MEGKGNYGDDWGLRWEMHGVLDRGSRGEAAWTKRGVSPHGSSGVKESCLNNFVRLEGVPLRTGSFGPAPCGTERARVIGS